jgi:16S rRNA (guanine527-N7)-methyltransferase
VAHELQQQLVAGIAAMQLDVPAQVPAKLIDYISLLNHWNRSFNLTAVRQPQEMVSKHLHDSLAVLPFIGEGSVIDVGSGAGLPGIPLALARPEQRFVLLDSNGKKTRFLQQAKIVLGLDNVEVVNQRVEQYSADIYFDVIIARAYASTDDILDTTRQLQGERTRILVMQGQRDEQIGLAGYAIEAIHPITVPGLHAERHLLEISKTHT